MATEKQKQAARRNLEKARAAQASGHGGSVHRSHRAQGSQEMSTAEKNDLPESAFAFPRERKEPLTDARHVRNAVARFNQVEGVSDAERDEAWRRVRSAASRFDVDLAESSWRELAHGGKNR